MYPEASMTRVDLEVAVLLGLGVLGGLAALAALPAAVRAVLAGTEAAADATRRRGRRVLGRVREAGAVRVARRGAAALLGSASALVALAGPARASAPPERLVVGTASAAAPDVPGAPPHRTTNASPSTAATRSAAAATVLVRRGDTLWDLARRHLPAGATDAQVARAWPRWYAANRAVIGPDPGLLLPGQRLRVPSARPTAASATSPTSAAQHRRVTAPPSVPVAAFDPDRR
jgi:resuscitation-promoting factor RpfA